MAGGVVLALSMSAARAESPLEARLQAARELAGVDPTRALAAVDQLRAEADAAGQQATRAHADEIACRLLSDLDVVRARDVVDAGIARFAQPPTARSTAREAWLRLRACQAGVMLDQRDYAGGDALLAELIDGADAAAWPVPRALALLERGVTRSRRGDYEAGQEDLLEACATLRAQGSPADVTLCIGHLANHYRRVGDDDEALKLLLGLREDAQRRGATLDLSVYTYSSAQAHAQREEWAQALADYSAAEALSRQVADPSGVAYAQNGAAEALLQVGDAPGALRRVRESLTLLSAESDPREYLVAKLTEAAALLALGQTAVAHELLESLTQTLRSQGEEPAQARWWRLHAQAASKLGEWRHAYEALSEADRLDAELAQRRLSQQSARLRMQFNRARDAEDLKTLRQLNEQGQRLRQMQALAIGGVGTLLVGALLLAWRKVRQVGRVQRLAATDELTGLPNRRRLREALDAALARGRTGDHPVAVVMFDVDRFKLINDTHGHAVGDEVLRHLARTLVPTLRRDDLLGRQGGEEFLAVMPGTAAPAALQVAERMRMALADGVVQLDSGSLRYTASAGVAVSHPGETAVTLLARADAALYRAKRLGRNRVEMATDDDRAGASLHSA